MKKLFKKTSIILYALIFIFNCLFFVNCSDNEVTTEPLSFESFEALGQIHNDFLSKVESDFEPNQQIVALDEGLDYIIKFQLDYLKTTRLTKKEQESFTSSLKEHKSLLVYDEGYNRFFSKNPNNGRSNADEGVYDLQEAIDKAYSNKLIDEFEYGSLSRLRDKVKLSYEGGISDSELKEYVINLKNNWIAQGYKLDSPNGRIMAYTLAISISSLEWWEDHPKAGISESANGRVMALPAWAAADIGGAIYAGASSALYQYGTTGEVGDWGAVGWSSLAGGVGLSTGAGGKIGSWISKLF